MSLSGKYDDENVFARILRGSAEVVKVYEDAQTLAFMDAFPQATGHVLVIPKEERCRNILDISGNGLVHLISTVQRVAQAVSAALAPDGVSILQFNGAAGGQTVYHLHFHVIPRWAGEELAPHAQGVGAERSELEAVAERISAAMSP